MDLEADLADALPDRACSTGEPRRFTMTTRVDGECGDALDGVGDIVVASFDNRLGRAMPDDAFSGHV